MHNCDWICQNPAQSHKNWNPFYSLTWKPHSSTIQTDQWQGWGWPGLLSQATFIWPCYIVNSWRSTAGCMVPLGRTNKATGGVKLFPTTVLSWHVHCGCFCALLNTQRLFLCASGWLDVLWLGQVLSANYKDPEAPMRQPLFSGSRDHT